MVASRNLQNQLVWIWFKMFISLHFNSHFILKCAVIYSRAKTKLSWSIKSYLFKWGQKHCLGHLFFVLSELLFLLTKDFKHILTFLHCYLLLHSICWIFNGRLYLQSIFYSRVILIWLVLNWILVYTF